MIRSLLAAVAVLALVGSAHAQDSAPAATLEQIAPAIDQRFRDYQERAHIPGLVWAVVREGQIVHFAGSGVQDLESQRPVNADTLFRIASMSKAFTALAILKLRDEGRLSLDEPVERYVTELRRWRYPTADSPRIRVRDLLSHVAGFVTDDPWGDRHQPLAEADFTRMLREGVPFQRPPQTAFEYSNFGYALLGRIIANVSRRPYNEYIQSEIMAPLGMSSTTYEVRDAPAERLALGYRWENEAFAEEPTMPHGVFGAMGGVVTSANDYARWMAFLLSAWPARDGPETGPVRRSSVRELAQGLNFIRVIERPNGVTGEQCWFALAYGKGLNLTEGCGLGTALSHGGGYPGYGSYMLLLPEHGVGVFAFANRTYAGPAAPVFDAAYEMARADLLPERATPVGAALARAYVAAGAMYQAGALGGENVLAMNFLMDRSAENWAREFARLKGVVGECRTDAPIEATGVLSGEFSWSCERGALQGNLLLSPDNPPAIQSLRFRPAPAQ